MSKRSPESTAKEGSAVAKPRTDEFGVKDPHLHQENASARFECFEQPCESRVGLSFVSSSGAKQQPRHKSTFSNVATR